jgi:tetratricopeptide (TPR) repeat protein
MNLFKKMFATTPHDSLEEKKQQEEKNFNILKHDGIAALQQQKFDYAVKCFESSLQIHDDLEVRDYLSQALIRTNRLDEAFEQLKALAEAQPSNVEICLRMADVSYMQEDYEEMGQICVKARDLAPNDPRVSYTSARAFAGQGNGVMAIAMLTKAIKDAEKSVSSQSEGETPAEEAPRAKVQVPFFAAYLLRGETLLKMGDTDSAMVDADFLLQHLPQQEDVLLFKARCVAAKGQHEEAEKLFSQIINLNPFCVEAFRGRGASRLALDKRKEAAEDARQVLELSPEEAKVNGDFNVEGKENMEEILAKLKAKREANLKK